MKFVLNFNDRVRVQLTEEGRKVLTEFRSKRGFFPMPRPMTIHELTIAELMAIFGPHVTVNNHGAIASPSMFVDDELGLQLSHE